MQIYVHNICVNSIKFCLLSYILYKYKKHWLDTLSFYKNRDFNFLKNTTFFKHFKQRDYVLIETCIYFKIDTFKMKRELINVNYTILNPGVNPIMLFKNM